MGAMKKTAAVPASVQHCSLRERRTLSPAVGCLAEIKIQSASTSVCLSHSVSGNYTRELVDNATTIRLTAVSSVFFFQNCHREKTMQHTFGLLQELPLCYCHFGALGLRPLFSPLDIQLHHTGKT